MSNCPLCLHGVKVSYLPLWCQIVLNNYKSSKNISQTESDVLYKKWSWVGGQRSVWVGQRSEDLECVALLVNNKMNLDSSSVAAFDQFQLRPNEVVIFRIFRDGGCQWMMLS